MNRVLIVGLLLSASAGPLLAQGTGGRPATLGTPMPGGIGTGASGLGPGFSPYLNLNRGGNSAAQNLYGIVRPQMSIQSSLQSLQQQVAGTGGTPYGDDGSAAQGITVGTRVRFLNTGGYFLNMAGGTTTSSGGSSGSTSGRSGSSSFGGGGSSGLGSASSGLGGGLTAPTGKGRK